MFAAAREFLYVPGDGFRHAPVCLDGQTLRMGRQEANDRMKTEWRNLMSSKEQEFFRGTVFRCPGDHPYEAVFDLMLIDYLHGDSGFALVVSSGQKAGLLRIILPVESRLSESRAVSVEWLKNNWRDWVYPCDPGKVEYTDHYIICRFGSDPSDDHRGSVEGREAPAARPSDEPLVHTSESGVPCVAPEQFL